MKRKLLCHVKYLHPESLKEIEGNKDVFRLSGSNQLMMSKSRKNVMLFV